MRFSKLLTLRGFLRNAPWRTNAFCSQKSCCSHSHKVFKMAANGDKYMAEGEKALNKSSIFGFLGGGNSKYENAAEEFKKAGNAYKLSNSWQSSGAAFARAAEVTLKSENPRDATNYYVEAGNSYKKISPVDAISCYMQAIELYSTDGRFGMCARYFKEIAEIYEGDHNVNDALEAYEHAADFFEKDNKKVNANQMMLKVAGFASEKGDVIRAADVFEKIALESLTSRLGAFSAKGYFFQCLLCHLASGDNVRVTNKIGEFKNADYSFGAARECGFIEKLLQACEDLNLEDFADACSDFDRITPLNPWQTSMLLKAKKHVSDNAGEEVDLS